MTEKISRRVAMRTGLQLACTCAALPLASSVRAATASCVEPASEALRGGLSYMDPAANPQVACGACAFFKLSKDPCGQCEIMSGAVSAKGHCESWAPREAGDAG